MGSQMSLIFFSLCLLLLLSHVTGNGAAESSSHHRGHGRRQHAGYGDRQVYAFQPTKLLVFGDSYADTGNNRKSESSSWKVPYGITFPGRPAGRFSSGRVLTDYLANSFGLKSPLPYRWRKIGARNLKYGMNFAYGGTGVFDTLVPYPNMTAQIGLLEELIEDSTFSAADLNSSLTLVTLCGNDYSTYTARNGFSASLPEFIGAVVNQLSTNLRRLHELGARKVAVAALQPLGCLPSWTAVNSFQRCNDTVNSLVGLHNQLLHRAVADLNNRTSSSTFAVMDLYASFMSVLNGTGDSKFEDPLKPCCVGVSSDFNCGSLDGDGTKKYTVCEDPELAFFWDTAHPTQAGWGAVYSSLSAALQKL